MGASALLSSAPGVGDTALCHCTNAHRYLIILKAVVGRLVYMFPANPHR